VDALLVGDSLGNVVQGKETTLPVTLDQIIYHTEMVKRGAPNTFVVADMPFLSYQISVEEALRNCGLVMKETNCDAVKLEGGEEVAHLVRRLTEIGIPVMGHIGVTPQSAKLMGMASVVKTYQMRNTLSAVQRPFMKQVLFLWFWKTWPPLWLRK